MDVVPVRWGALPRNLAKHPACEGGKLEATWDVRQVSRLDWIKDVGLGTADVSAIDLGSPENVAAKTTEEAEATGR
eukprot:Skav208783  [mRNA]  locus=scaffold3559:139368:140291:+ [translate_table: standard]